MGSEFGIAPLREVSAFGAEIDRCVVIEIVAHKNGSQGKNKSTAQLQVLKILSRYGTRADRQRTTFFSRRTVHMAKLKEAACLPRRRQNFRKHRPEQLSDGPTAFSSHATVPIPQTRSDVRARHCANPYRWSDLSRCVEPFLRCDGEEHDHIHSHFCRPAWSRVEVGRLAHKERIGSASFYPSHGHLHPCLSMRLHTR